MDFIVLFPGGRPNRIRDIASALFRRAMMSDLVVCRGYRCPSYHQVEESTADVSQNYMRLLLPVVNRHGAVDRIYAFCRPLSGNSQSKQEKVVPLAWSELQ